MATLDFCSTAELVSKRVGLADAKRVICSHVGAACKPGSKACGSRKTVPQLRQATYHIQETSSCCTGLRRCWKLSMWGCCYNHHRFHDKAASTHGDMLPLRTGHLLSHRVQVNVGKVHRMCTWVNRCCTTLGRPASTISGPSSSLSLVNRFRRASIATRHTCTVNSRAHERLFSFLTHTAIR